MINGLLFALGLLAAGMSAIFVDQDWAQFYGHPENEHLWLAARQITDFALGEYWFGLAIITYAVVKLLPKKWHRWPGAFERAKNWSIYLFVGIFGSGIILRFLKLAIGRQRPHRSPEFDPFVFEPFAFSSYFEAMPSGHTQVIFAVATSLFVLSPKSGWIVFPAAAAMAFTRVMTTQHFMSDIIVGAMIGYFGTLWVYSWLEKRVPRPSAPPKNRSIDASI